MLNRSSSSSHCLLLWWPGFWAKQNTSVCQQERAASKKGVWSPAGRHCQCTRTIAEKSGGKKWRKYVESGRHALPVFPPRCMSHHGDQVRESRQVSLPGTHQTRTVFRIDELEQNSRHSVIFAYSVILSFGHSVIQSFGHDHLVLPFGRSVISYECRDRHAKLYGMVPNAVLAHQSLVWLWHSDGCGILIRHGLTPTA